MVECLKVKYCDCAGWRFIQYHGNAQELDECPSCGEPLKVKQRELYFQLLEQRGGEFYPVKMCSMNELISIIQQNL